MILEVGVAVILLRVKRHAIVSIGQLEVIRLLVNDSLLSIVPFRLIND